MSLTSSTHHRSKPILVTVVGGGGNEEEGTPHKRYTHIHVNKSDHNPHRDRYQVQIQQVRWHEEVYVCVHQVCIVVHLHECILHAKSNMKQTSTQSCEHMYV